MLIAALALLAILNSGWYVVILPFVPINYMRIFVFFGHFPLFGMVHY